MHYDVEYDTDDPAEHLRAIKDLTEYIGVRAYEALLELAADKAVTLESYQLYASIAGVSGFPVRALYTRERKIHSLPYLSTADAS